MIFRMFGVSLFAGVGTLVLDYPTVVVGIQLEQLDSDDGYLNFAELDKDHEWIDEELMGLSETKAHTGQWKQIKSAVNYVFGTQEPAAGSTQPVQKLHIKTQRKRPVRYG